MQPARTHGRAFSTGERIPATSPRRESRVAQLASRGRLPRSRVLPVCALWLCVAAQAAAQAPPLTFEGPSGFSPSTERAPGQAAQQPWPGPPIWANQPSAGRLNSSRRPKSAPQSDFAAQLAANWLQEDDPPDALAPAQPDAPDDLAPARNDIPDALAPVQPETPGGRVPSRSRASSIAPSVSLGTAIAPTVGLSQGTASFAPQISPATIAGPETRQTTAQTVSANLISGAEAATRATTDAGNLLKQSHNDPGVYVQQRSPIIGDPRIRGYRFGQYLARADGAAWYPARLDVDSIISKIDSHVIQDVIVLNGPYSAQYGPGFAFIDIVTNPTPRYNNGFDWEASTGMNYNINGDQFFASQNVQGGSDNYGFNFFYSHRNGEDYKRGGGDLVPSSYKARNFNGAFGVDLSKYSSVEVKYLRQDLTDVELAGQLTDIDFLVTDGWNVNYSFVKEDEFVFSVSGWYNRTRAEGSGQRSAKQALFASAFLPGNVTRSNTDFDVMST
ncbi:MAG: TonB-dependent receptor plug domain-containing protein, partial [Planctomycetales bacterium]